MTVVAICSSHGPATAGAALTLLSVGVVGATGLLLLRTRSGEAGRWAARALAAAAGACFAVDAVFLQRAAQLGGTPTVSTVVNLAGFLAASFVGGVRRSTGPTRWRPCAASSRLWPVRNR